MMTKTGRSGGMHSSFQLYTLGASRKGSFAKYAKWGSSVLYALRLGEHAHTDTTHTLGREKLLLKPNSPY